MFNIIYPQSLVNKGIANFLMILLKYKDNNKHILQQDFPPQFIGYFKQGNCFGLSVLFGYSLYQQQFGKQSELPIDNFDWFVKMISLAVEFDYDGDCYKEIVFWNNFTSAPSIEDQKELFRFAQILVYLQNLHVYASTIHSKQVCAQNHLNLIPPDTKGCIFKHEAIEIAHFSNVKTLADFFFNKKFELYKYKLITLGTATGMDGFHATSLFFGEEYLYYYDPSSFSNIRKISIANFNIENCLKLAQEIFSSYEANPKRDIVIKFNVYSFTPEQLIPDLHSSPSIIITGSDDDYWRPDQKGCSIAAMLIRSKVEIPPNILHGIFYKQKDLQKYSAHLSMQPILCTLILFKRDLQYIRLLIEAGANINQCGCDKHTALSFAVTLTEKCIEIVKELLLNGADPFIHGLEERCNVQVLSIIKCAKMFLGALQNFENKQRKPWQFWQSYSELDFRAQLEKARQCDNDFFLQLVAAVMDIHSKFKCSEPTLKIVHDFYENHCRSLVTDEDHMAQNFST